MHPLITICVPVYRAATFVEETLYGIQQQSFGDFSVLVSVDQSQDNSEEMCRAFDRDNRFTVMAQSKRLGWAGNVNFLLDRVNTEYFAILFHDDLWHKDYLSILFNLLSKEQTASVAYSDVERFGMRDGPFHCRSYGGVAFERVYEYLSQPFHAIPIRGLIRSELLNSGFRLREYGFEGFLAERLGVFEILYAGQGLHWPELLYRKRVVETSLSKSWASWPKDRILSAWAAHCAAFVEVINSTSFSTEEKQKLMDLQPQHITTLVGAFRDALSILVEKMQLNKPS